ncbi:THUMP-like domain-containing protein [Flavobacterium tibetense]|uniref:Class I SAM-dependent methyltransferase n=1 Tax=Flavobacterium tibetense TaxID=2233533 RepID=A0A365P038_9FLAO|nr:RsmD family RNA methyltransferase [Flavobacterium tibetense]RBA27829.1 class I SAM-dependent methyltransferase [Flavobacterium tibetense]
MDFSKILQPEIQQFISENGSVNINQLALKKNPFPEIPYSVLLNQIAAKQKAKDKLPTWYHANNIIYPEKISIEQTSSEITAKYKASLLSGTSVIDLTGGFGVDDYYFSKVVEKVIHSEINAELSEIVKHNCKQLQVDNMECFAGDSAVLLKDLNQKFDTIYIDPSRRNDTKGKVFLLADCLPNVVDLQDFYFTYSNKILVKTAPILDIQAGLNELKNVKKIHIVAVENEVKELLWEIEKNWNSIPVITTINFEKNRVFQNEIALKSNETATYSLPKKYLYEPNAALMKSGCFEAISSIFSVDKLHQHSHLYTSDLLQPFSGRNFEIITAIPYQKNEIKTHLLNKKMNVTTRNFPLKVDEIKKKHKISDGGTIFAFFTTNLNNEKIVLLCEKIENHE